MCPCPVVVSGFHRLIAGLVNSSNLIRMITYLFTSFFLGGGHDDHVIIRQVQEK